MDLIKDGGNWYQYCYSNPLRYWDPTGLAGFSLFGCLDVNSLVNQLQSGIRNIQDQLSAFMGNINWGRVGTGIMKGLGGLAVLAVGAAVVGATGGAALPAIMALLSGTMTGASLITLGTLGAGIGAMLFGTADIFEGSQDAILGVLGSNTAAYNPIRDELFGGNAELYYMTEAMLSYGASAGLYVYQSYDLGGQLETAASMNYGRGGVVAQGESNANYGSQIVVSDQKMYQLGDHFNKHGRSMGYTSKKAYEAGARKFIEDNKNTAKIFEGVWNSSRGTESGQTQIIIRSEGKQVIVNKSSGQIIDFYEGTSLDGFKEIREVQ